MENLNKIELIILEKLSIEYPTIKNHIPCLRVLSREKTGVGMYVNFCYTDTKSIEKLDINDGVISTNENIAIDNLENGLGYEVDITDGLIKFIEFITYGEIWDGEFQGAIFSAW